jgi:hypothetical protein
MKTHACFCIPCFFMRAGDLLPASLQQLDIGEINSVQRLVGLTALRNLSAYASHVPQLRLQRVAKSLTQLTRVSTSIAAA